MLAWPGLLAPGSQVHSCSAGRCSLFFGRLDTLLAHLLAVGAAAHLPCVCARGHGSRSCKPDRLCALALARLRSLARSWSYACAWTQQRLCTPVCDRSCSLVLTCARSCSLARACSLARSCSQVLSFSLCANHSSLAVRSDQVPTSRAANIYMGSQPVLLS
jgi:hypothetical protein